MTTAHDLLYSCPDDQITRMQVVWKAAAAGNWKEAAHHLRNAANEGDSTWHDRAAMLADEYEAKGDSAAKALDCCAA